MRIRYCRKSDCFTIVINTSTCSSTVFASVYNNIMCVNSKLDNEDSILSYSNNTWVIGISIRPTYKMIMIISHSSESCNISIVVRTYTSNCTIFCTRYYLICVRRKLCFQCEIFCCNKCQWVFNTAVRPSNKMITFRWSCGYSYGIAMRVCACTCNSSIVSSNNNFIYIYRELCT